MAHIYNSSFHFTTLTPFSKDDYRKAKHIISHIIENPQSMEFREPVNWQALNLLDYPQIVKNPMDLGTILAHLNQESYENVEQFLDDFELIWDNCKTYNIKGTWIYSLADKLQKNGKKMLKNYFPTIPLQSIKTLMQNPMSPAPAMTQKVSNSEHKSSQLISKPAAKPKKQERERTQRPQKSEKLYYQDEQEITLGEKMKMADKFQALSPSQNKEIVEFIQILCPTAFREQEERVQILVDNMDIITFKQVMEKIEEIEEQGDLTSAPSKKVKFD